MTEDHICGSTDTSTDEPCQRPAGWGRDGVESGPCITHHEDTEPTVPYKLRGDEGDNLISSVEADLEAGHSFKVACESNGISDKTGHAWLRAAEDIEDNDTERAEKLLDFSDRVSRARGVGQRSLERQIVNLSSESARPDVLLKYLQEIRGGEESQEDVGPLALIPDDDQLEDLLVDVEP